MRAAKGGQRHRDALTTYHRTQGLAPVVAERLEVDHLVRVGGRQSDIDLGDVGVLAFQLYATLGDLEGCRRQLAQLRSVDRGWDRTVTTALEQFEAFVADAEAGRGG